MVHAARKIALLLIVALLFVPAAVRAQQHLQPTDGASLTKFGKSAEAARERADMTVGLAAVADPVPAVILVSSRADRPVDAVPVVPSAQPRSDTLRAPPAF